MSPKKELILSSRLAACFTRHEPTISASEYGWDSRVSLIYGPSDFTIIDREHFEGEIPPKKKQSMIHAAQERRLLRMIAQMWAFAELWKIRP